MYLYKIGGSFRDAIDLYMMNCNQVIDLSQQCSSVDYV
jgi:hypothetical protein